jgi:catechol 2,3-dioxygenase-like lactoylglutathione lyase family enzyme
MNRVTHFEIYTNDPKAVQPFYQDVFGWKFDKFEGGPIEYWLVTTGDDKDPGINGGITRPREGQSPGTLNTVAIESLDQTIRSSNAGEKSAFRRWRSQRSAGLLTRQIQLAMSLELFSRTRTPNKQRTRL